MNKNPLLCFSHHIRFHPLPKIMFFNFGKRLFF